MKHKSRKHSLFYLVSVFIIIEAILYLLFMSFDILEKFTAVSNLLKYGSILLCVLMSFLLFDLHSWNLRHGLVTLGLFFTAVSDYFLLFSTNFVPGLYSFCVVQTVYLILLFTMKVEGKWPERFVPRVCVRFLLAIAFSVLLLRFTDERIVFLLPLCFYAISFIDNIKVSFQSSNRRFRIGLIVFALCDINVLLYNLSGYVMLPAGAVAFFDRYSMLAMWLFYLPAQVMITLSQETRSRLMY